MVSPFFSTGRVDRTLARTVRLNGQCNPFLGYWRAVLHFMRLPVRFVADLKYNTFARESRRIHS
jgi:hypothetical protein